MKVTDQSPAPEAETIFFGFTGFGRRVVLGDEEDDSLKHFLSGASGQGFTTSYFPNRLCNSVLTS